MIHRAGAGAKESFLSGPSLAQGPKNSHSPAEASGARLMRKKQTARILFADKWRNGRLCTNDKSNMCREIRQLHVAPPDTCCAGDILAMRDFGFSLCRGKTSQRAGERTKMIHNVQRGCSFQPTGREINAPCFPFKGAIKRTWPCVWLNGAWRKTHACTIHNWSVKKWD